MPIFGGARAGNIELLTGPCDRAGYRAVSLTVRV